MYNVLFYLFSILINISINKKKQFFGNSIALITIVVKYISDGIHKGQKEFH